MSRRRTFDRKGDEMLGRSTARGGARTRRKLALLGAVLGAAAAVGITPASAATPCVYPAGTTMSGTTATATFSVACANTQVSVVSIVHGANPSDDAIFASATGAFGVGSHSLDVALKCATNSEAECGRGPPALSPPLDLDINTTAFHVECAPPPP